jgi:hypothetical protein
MVQALPERAMQLNGDPRYHHFAVRLAVFGSYLTDKPVLGDLDIFAQFVARRQRGKEDWVQFRTHFPPPASIDYDWFRRLQWPESKFRRDLKLGRDMHIHDWAELEMLGCSYRLLLDVRDRFPGVSVGENVGATGK